MNGIIVIDKEKNVTSRDVVNKISKILIEELINNKIDISFNEYRAPQANIDLNASAVNKFIPFDDDTTEL